jgi:hypothetical protein
MPRYPLTVSEETALRDYLQKGKVFSAGGYKALERLRKLKSTTFQLQAELIEQVFRKMEK